MPDDATPNFLCTDEAQARAAPIAVIHDGKVLTGFETLTLLDRVDWRIAFSGKGRIAVSIFARPVEGAKLDYTPEGYVRVWQWLAEAGFALDGRLILEDEAL